MGQINSAYNSVKAAMSKVNNPPESNPKDKKKSKIKSDPIYVGIYRPMISKGNGLYIRKSREKKKFHRQLKRKRIA